MDSLLLKSVRVTISTQFFKVIANIIAYLLCVVTSDGTVWQPTSRDHL